MRIMEGSNVSAAQIARANNPNRPEGYIYVPPGYGLRPGYVRSGPDHDMKTTVVLFPNDDGAWFREAVERAGGTVILREQ